MSEVAALRRHGVAVRARAAAAGLAPLPRKVKDAALHAMADALVARTEEVLAGNSEDVEAGRVAGTARRCSTGSP
jgi:glutamate-5-semialdehyde dehydrogenase